MKKIIIVLSLISLIGCNSENSIPRETQIENKKFILMPTGKDNDFKPTNIPLDKNATPAELLNAVKTQKDDYEKLLKTVQIAVPSSRVSSRELVNADVTYRSFIENHKNEPVLATFRNTFARLILEDYQLLETTDYTKIKYYTEELIKAKSENSELITKSLIKLKSGGSEIEFKNLQVDAINVLNENNKINERLINFLQERVSQLKKNPEKRQGTLKVEFTIALLEQKIKELKANQSATSLRKVASL